MNKEIENIMEEYILLYDIVSKKPVFWISDYKIPFSEVENFDVRMSDIQDAEERLERFKPFLKNEFEELVASDGLIESELTKIKKMEKKLKLKGSLYLKQDNELQVAGSIKARGGIYEVLKHTEKLAFENNLIDEFSSYEELSKEENKKFFSKYTIQVGSTGNLGLSIGIISAKIGYKVIVHMSSDAKTWKKDLLREKGVKVVEYPDDYSRAVEEGRRLSDLDKYSYFIDDEKSLDLFLGYGVAASRLKKQLEAEKIKVDSKNPLFVYLPCGVGGGPGGIAFGLKLLYGDNVHCFFAEPTHSPCMLIGMYTKTYDKYSVQDFGLDNRTIADGLAVGRASGFVSRALIELLNGVYTVTDDELYKYQYELYNSEKIYLEPSACAGFKGVVEVENEERLELYLKNNSKYMKNATHIVWGTGGSLVPEPIRDKQLSIGKNINI